ncbi:MAG: hypothetical protein UX80_C0009G0032 [Candidatus Amesbacteria bacterium GW2011_GWA2_47_11b]|uniref:Uncharacterized protein n=3 Tax=Candidatus Amesiibacteriota TaxID=1752730 RepID=A0A0G1SIX7_9BACT|nr:MAG: hypothetical protein UX00_C0011G0036 [Microgenomates group bacterium GW2011_GWB1_45_17]KKU28876.1 MAG: hypothetical protein UX42_C0006G0028 [Microgenomates group bacterium GW2011_GWC1_46_20]KKU57817.1 MAG: hypothetical protein UX80_C0009G0032 [Candidatus Amesbacteria bacterium GW2011_GWA2_47_11b]KKU69407.1 MAG: hypothetical protein UX92_C0013G0012 [Candidatus Amesbacteria bacterium GW2011_GWA1_47_20]KKU82461.1 MAG: hypothetical protein UY11_C0047G0009 [Candidatus Amesbacteria bacterium 
MEIVVRFSQGKVKPETFWWNGREYQVERIPLIFERKDGGRKYLCFSVDCGGMIAELVMDKEDLTWRLIKCAPSYT